MNHLNANSNSPGADVGDTVGANVGDSVGSAVGTRVGAAVGDAVGAPVGAAVGSAVGGSVGVAVGCGVGRAVGVIDGRAVGDAVLQETLLVRITNPSLRLHAQTCNDDPVPSTGSPADRSVLQYVDAGSQSLAFTTHGCSVGKAVGAAVGTVVGTDVGAQLSPPQQVKARFIPHGPTWSVRVTSTDMPSVAWSTANVSPAREFLAPQITWVKSRCMMVNRRVCVHVHTHRVRVCACAWCVCVVCVCVCACARARGGDKCATHLRVI